jgi:glycosyltransferase involved in cell wall biosynthesis
VEIHKNIASVSVVIPCYRCVDTIARAVKSVDEQTLRPYEVILIEDSSGDDTLEALYKLQSEYDNGWIKVIPLSENSGPGTARNTGWDVSDQEYIAFLDADDAWHPQKIEIQYQWMVEHPEVALTGHTQTRVSEDKPSYQAMQITEPHCVSSNALLLKNEFSTRSVMLKANIDQRFIDGQYFCEDYLLWLRISLPGQKCYKFEAPLAYVFKSAYGERGLASNLWQMEKGELYSYAYLLQNALITPPQKVLYSAISFIKYLKRVITVTLRLNQ